MKPIRCALRSMGVAWVGLLVQADGARSQTVLWESSVPNALWGWSVRGAGDIDGDGIPELIVGGPGFPLNAGPSSQQYRGLVRVLSGTNGATIHEIVGAAPQDQLGWRVGGFSDLTGDGTPEFLVSSAFADARVHDGANGTIVYSFPTPGSVAAPGDLDLDGVADILVGSGAGIVYSGASGQLIYSEPPPIYGNPLWIGYSVAGVGDIDGDGTGDFVLGALGGTLGSGGALVLSGLSGKVLAGFSGSATQDGFGRAVVGPGDLTGDGVPDFAVGRPGGPYGPPAGEVRVFSGASLSMIAIISGKPGVHGGFGFSLDAPGDADGDAIPDFVVGAPGGTASWPYGLAGIYSGADGSMLVEVDGGTMGSFGWSVAAPGDLNGDDFPEFAVGQMYAPSYASENVKVFSGAPDGVSVLGTGCAPTGVTPPRIGMSRTASIGTTCAVNLSKVDPGAGALLLLGLSDTAWWGIPLPLSLGILGLPACSLLVSPDFILPFTTSRFGASAGRAIAPIAIPQDGSLVGAAFYAQWFVVGPGGIGQSAMTRALEVVVQP